MTTFLLVLVAIEAAALVVVTILYRKAKKAQKKRRVEAPNSQYKSQYVVDLEAQDRWEKMDLSRLHEVNREEVEKILVKVRATSVRALTTHERAFLDRMADAHDRVARDERRKGGARPRPARGTS
jgi:CBS-domain-containing membrane protein